MNIRLKKNILTDDGVKFESEIIELNDELAQKLQIHPDPEYSAN